MPWASTMPGRSSILAVAPVLRRVASRTGQGLPGASPGSTAAHFHRRGQQLAGDENLAGRIGFRVGDTESLDLGDGEFDAVVAHTLISHVESPAAVLAEIARIAKPGGSIGIFDGDYASLTFGHPDPDQGKRDDEALIAAIVTNPRVMRQMPVLAREAGLELVASFPYVLAEVGKADFWLPAIESFRKLMPTAGAMTEAEARRMGRSLDAGIRVGPLLRRQQLLRIRPAQAGARLTTLRDTSQATLTRTSPRHEAGMSAPSQPRGSWAWTSRRTHMECGLSTGQGLVAPLVCGVRVRRGERTGCRRRLCRDSYARVGAA